jgi:hypothetical protein
LLGYHDSIIISTGQKNNIFNGIKALDRLLTFEYLPANKNVVTYALSRLKNDSLKIQEEESLMLLLRSENSSISNIKSTIPMHTPLIFKEQAKVKEPGLREKGLA